MNEAPYIPRNSVSSVRINAKETEFTENKSTGHYGVSSAARIYTGQVRVRYLKE
jgi:hypothetical protein